MENTRFGIEIELTGITRCKAAGVIAKTLNGTKEHVGGAYDTYEITLPDRRKWKVVSDASISTIGGRNTSVEIVSPILTPTDIDSIQELVREIKKGGGKTNASCGIHIHLDGYPHTVKSLKNFINIIYARNDLLYKSLQIDPRRMGYCKKLDQRLVDEIRNKKPKTMQQLKDIWYDQRNAGTYSHYHKSRYHFLNLHSYFTGTHTVELRGFNSTLHAGKVKAYILLALALNNQALTQTKATTAKPQVENEKFAMRIYLNRIGFIGAEYKNYREHLIKHLDGSAAWRYGYNNPKYKKNKKEEEKIA